MRILLFTTASAFTPDVQMLMHLVVALGARGEVAGVACVQGSATAESVAAHWPRLTLRTFGAAGTTRPGSGARGVISALRPDVVLVGSARTQRWRLPLWVDVVASCAGWPSESRPGVDEDHAGGVWASAQWLASSSGGSALRW